MSTKLTLARLKELLVYDSLTGVVLNKKTSRVLLPDHDGLVVIFCSKQKKAHKLKLDRIAYSLAFDVVPRVDQRVLHVDLDQHNNKLQNLILVSRLVYLQIKEAHKNLTYGIKITAHRTDQFNYVLHWIENNHEKQKVICDIIEARRLSLKLQLKYSKILTKYCVFD